MAYPQVNQIYKSLSDDMGHKLGMYHAGLQARYADPRGQMQEEEEMRREHAAAEYTKSQKTSKLLEDAYARQQARNRESHNDRFKHRGDRTSSAPPESEEQKPQRRRKVQFPSAAEPSD